MGRAIDTSVLIEAERAGENLDFVLAAPAQPYFLSVITASELLHGVERATRLHRRLKRAQFVEDALSRIAIIDVDITIARLHAGLVADLQSRGQVIGVHDMWIAATCLAHELTLVTMNERDFRRVRGLNVEVWGHRG